MLKTVLVVEDDIALAESVSEILSGEGLEVTIALNGRDGCEAFKIGDFNAVLTDFRLPRMGGFELLEAIKEHSSKVPIIMMTGYGTSNLAIEATRKGVFGYLIKPFKTLDLINLMKKAVQTPNPPGRSVGFGVIDHGGKYDVMIGNSPEMQKVYREIGSVADKNISVLIQGETGTGKELIARAIYHHGGHHDQSFVAINCAAIPNNLLESELFGHERGAFTGASTRRIGRFEQAEAGTLFLDEIGDMTLETQVKMLRVLQEKTIRRVGGNSEISVDVRMISATHENLEKAVADGRFREDLFYRINAATIDLPPLREREGDISLLIDHFINRFCHEFDTEPPHLKKTALETLQNHHWPGNVRELANVTCKLIINSNGPPLSRDDIKSFLTQSTNPMQFEASDFIEIGQKQRIQDLLVLAKAGKIQNPYATLIENLEREMIFQMLELSHANQSLASKTLGISRVTFREKMAKFGMLPAKK